LRMMIFSGSRCTLFRDHALPCGDFLFDFFLAPNLLSATAVE